MDKVYFFTNGVNIKIGYTKLNIEKRLKQLNTGSDTQLYPLGFVSGNKSLEKELHQKFAKFRIRNNGEWFFPDYQYEAEQLFWPAQYPVLRYCR